MLTDNDSNLVCHIENDFPVTAYKIGIPYFSLVTFSHICGSEMRVISHCV